MKLFTQKRNTRYGQLNNSENLPVGLELNPFNSNKIEYANGAVEQGICLNCLAHPCMDYNQDEINVEILPGMPYANSTKVCPTDAICLDLDGFPMINASACIGCGLCLTRCVYGAISLNQDFSAYIQKSESKQIVWSTEIDEVQQGLRDALFANAPITFETSLFPKDYFTQLYEKLPRHIRSTNGFDNIFVRNLFLNLGIRTKVRAVGNNDIRFDMLGRIESLILVGEIGLNGVDILQEPRAMLDDLAVLKSRYDIEHSSVLPLMITLTFPNKRSDVYEVIHDIKQILGIQIFSISVHFLIVLNLLRKKFDKIGPLSHFYVDKKGMSTVEAALKFIPELARVDPFLRYEFYQAMK